MRKFLNLCNKAWNRVVINNSLVPTGMIPCEKSRQID